MPTLLFQIVTILFNIVILLFLGYYIQKIYDKEKKLDQKEKKIDADYHKVVDNALTRERQIISDATHEADQIIKGAHHVSDESKKSVEEALSRMVADIQKQAMEANKEFIDRYHESLKELVNSSLADYQGVSKQTQSELQTSLSNFQRTTKSMESDLQIRIKTFQESVIPKMEKELEEMKRARMVEAERRIVKIIQTASQDVLNKTISPEDHEKLIIESLEKAKMESVFD